MPTISGTVYDELGQPVSGRIVRAYRRDTGALIGESRSGGAGKKRLITFTGASGAGTGYQVLLKIGESAGASGADFHITTAQFPTTGSLGDIAFRANDLTTVYPAWVEQVTGTAPNRVAWVWVKVLDSLESSATFFILYNLGVEVQQPSGGSVFDLFDDFSGAVLDTEKWTYQTGSGATVSGGELSRTGNASYTRIRSLATTFPDGREIVGRFYVPNTTQGYVGEIGWASGGGSYVLINRWENQSVSAMGISGAYTNLAAKFVNAYYRIQVGRAGGAGRLVIDGTVRHSASSGVFTAGAQASILSLYDNGSQAKVDWAGVKKYIATEPALQSVGSETDHLVGVGVYAISTGAYSGECYVVCLDDAAGTTYNDLILRTTPV